MEASIKTHDELKSVVLDLQRNISFLNDIILDYSFTKVTHVRSYHAETITKHANEIIESANSIKKIINRNIV